MPQITLKNLNDSTPRVDTEKDLSFNLPTVQDIEEKLESPINDDSKKQQASENHDQEIEEVKENKNPPENEKLNPEKKQKKRSLTKHKNKTFISKNKIKIKKNKSTLKTKSLSRNSSGKSKEKCCSHCRQGNKVKKGVNVEVEGTTLNNDENNIVEPMEAYNDTKNDSIIKNSASVKSNIKTKKKKYSKSKSIRNSVSSLTPFKNLKTNYGFGSKNSSNIFKKKKNLLSSKTDLNKKALIKTKKINSSKIKIINTQKDCRPKSGIKSLLRVSQSTLYTTKIK